MTKTEIMIHRVLKDYKTDIAEALWKATKGFTIRITNLSEYPSFQADMKVADKKAVIQIAQIIERRN